MKIKIEQIKGSLRDKVETTIEQLKKDGFEIVGIFKFVDVDFQYQWRSKGKFISIRITKPEMGFENYTSKDIYYK